MPGGTSVSQENSANYFQEDGFEQSLRKAYENSGTLSSSASNTTTIENTVFRGNQDYQCAAMY